MRFGIREQDTGDTAEMQADYVTPMATAGPTPDFVCGGRYAVAALRTDDGWRLSEVVVREKWRRLSRAADGACGQLARRPVF
ncbi:nuclear transport factor 2 family protein [Streptomyces sp. NPDC088801]|uniref:nuclear transport factor 2 family protein n=1 Tax=Streptomyces sp. NPDC088801 TaxID=3365903 RepID=UPI00380BAEF6